jgi:hypothetical protein
MARKLDKPNASGGTTDHSVEIAVLRQLAYEVRFNHNLLIQLNLAADLLESHDQSGISLDNWSWARQYVESYIGVRVIPNGV